jgi:hypothetical protein
MRSHRIEEHAFCARTVLHERTLVEHGVCDSAREVVASALERNLVVDACEDGEPLVHTGEPNAGVVIDAHRALDSVIFAETREPHVTRVQLDIHVEVREPDMREQWARQPVQVLNGAGEGERNIVAVQAESRKRCEQCDDIGHGRARST